MPPQTSALAISNVSCATLHISFAHHKRLACKPRWRHCEHERRKTCCARPAMAIIHAVKVLSRPPQQARGDRDPVFVIRAPAFGHAEAKGRDRGLIWRLQTRGVSRRRASKRGKEETQNERQEKRKKSGREEGDLVELACLSPRKVFRRVWHNADCRIHPSNRLAGSFLIAAATGKGQEKGNAEEDASVSGTERGR